MQIAASHDPVQAFMASRDAAVRRLSAGGAANGFRPEAGKSLTPTAPAVDPVRAARSASGPVLGRTIDLVA
jgi:hypothetical protein